MELIAAIEALTSIRKGSVVTLSSDSEYLIRGIEHLASRCAAQGWRNRKGLPINDRFLWQTLVEMKKHHFIRPQWIRGHDGHSLQVEADKLAYSEAQRRWCAFREAA